MNKRRFAALVAASLLASCGGGGGGTMNVAPSAPSKPAQTETVKIKLLMPAAVSQARHRQFVSPSAQGASIAVTGAQGGSGSGVVDLSATSSACTGSGAARTCTASVVVPVDTDTFVVTLYDAPPAAGAIPATAHVLGVGKVIQQITAAFTGSVPIVVGGTVSGIGLSATYLSLPANGTPQSVGIAIAPTDFGNNPLSSSTAPYANPITVTLTQTGGTGHMQLLLNGVASGTTATLTLPSDTVSVQYDGLGNAGYTSNISLAAPGATAETLTVSPLFLSSTSTFFASGTLALNGAATNVAMSATEGNAPAAITYSTNATGCSSIASLGPLSGSGASAAFNVAGGSTASASGCSIAVSDNLGTSVTFHVINSPVGGTIPLPGESVQEFAIQTNASAPPASPQALTEGPDGKIWLSDVLNTTLWSVTKTGVATAGTTNNLYIYPGGLTSGTDGNIYAADTNNVSIDKINPADGSVTNFWTTSYTPHDITAGSDGNVWFTESGSGSGLVGSYSPGGVLTEYDLSAAFSVASPSPAGIAANPAGGLWFCDDVNVGTARIDAVSYGGTPSTIVGLPTDCTTIAFQPDGKAAWVTSASAPAVYRIDTTTKTVTATITLTGNPVQIIAGADGAMYVSEYSTQGLIGRISLTSPFTLNEIATPTTAALPTGIALGADGRIWFGENSQNKIGALTP